MRLAAHWFAFFTLLLPLLWLGYTRVHHLGFPTYLAVLGAVTMVILGVFRLVEKLAPTPNDDDEKGS